MPPQSEKCWPQRDLPRLPRRRDDERLARSGSTIEAVADAREFSLASREFTTRVGGLFLFIPDLVRFNPEALAVRAKLPGSRMIPAPQALLASLAPISSRSSARATSWRSLPTMVSACSLALTSSRRIGVFLAHYPAESHNPARRLARSARRRNDPAWQILQPRLPLRALFSASIPSCSPII
jgi:hypothetical protein